MTAAPLRPPPPPQRQPPRQSGGSPRLPLADRGRQRRTAAMELMQSGGSPCLPLADRGSGAACGRQGPSSRRVGCPSPTGAAGPEGANPRHRRRQGRPIVAPVRRMELMQAGRFDTPSADSGAPSSRQSGGSPPSAASLPHADTLYVGHALCWLRFMLATLYVGYALCWPRFMLATLYVGYALCWPRFMLATPTRFMVALVSKELTLRPVCRHGWFADLVAFTLRA